MKIRIYDIGELASSTAYVEYSLQIEPVYSETLNETFDTLSCTLPYMERKTPFEPQRLVIFYNDNHEIVSRMVITKDDVEVVSHEEQLYKHTLICAEFMQNFNKHYIKDMKFSQPPKPKKIDYAGWSFMYYNSSTDAANPNYSCLALGSTYAGLVMPCSIILNAYEKVKSVRIHSDMYAMDKTETLKGYDVISGSVSKYGGQSRNTLKVYHGDTQVYEDTYIYSSSGDENDIVFETASEITKLGLDSGEQRTVQFFFNNNYANSGITPIDGFSTDRPFIDLHLRLEVETYYFTLWDVLEEIRLADYQKYSKHSNDNGNFANGVRMPSGALKTKLQSIIAPEIVIQQMTTYQALDEIAKILDGVWKIDNDSNELEIEYLNNLDATKSISDTADEKLSLSDNNYADTLVCYYQNGKPNQDNLKITPSNTSWKRVEGASLGAFNISNMVLKLDSPIEDIAKFEVFISSARFSMSYNLGTQNPTSRFVYLEDYYLDITDFICSSEEYTMLTYKDGKGSGESDLITPTTLNSVYFEQGSNTIPVLTPSTNILGITLYTLVYAIRSALCKKFGFDTGNSYYGTHTHEWYLDADSPSGFFGSTLDACFRVAYKTSIEGKLKIEGREDKNNYEILTNTGVGEPSMDKLGNNMFGLACKVAQPELVKTLKFSTFDERIKKGDIQIIDDEIWRADVVNTTLYNDYVLSRVVFVKNFNQLSRRIEVNQQQRFYEVQKEIKSEDVITEYFKFSSKDVVETKKTDWDLKTALDKNFGYLFATNFINGSNLNDVVDNYTLDGEVKIGQCCYINGASLTSDATSYLNMPFISFGAANSLFFKAWFNHPLSASYEVKSNPYRNVVVRYTDNSGFIDTCSLYFFNFDKSKQIQTAARIPYLNADKIKYISLDDYYVHKRPNEIMGLTFQLTLVPHKDDLNVIFFGESLSVRNTLITGKLRNTCTYLSGTEKYSLFDKKGKGTKYTTDQISAVYLDDDSGRFKVESSIAMNYQHLSWAICDEHDNIIIALNQEDDGRFWYYPKGRSR